MPDLTALKLRLGDALGLWVKVFKLLRYSGWSMGAAVLGLTLAEIALTLGALLMLKDLAEHLTASGARQTLPVDLFGSVFLLLLVFLASRVAAAFGTYYRSTQGRVVTDYVNQAIQDRAVQADLGFYDSALYYDNLQRARQAGAGRPAQVVANALNVLRGGLLLGSIVLVIATVEWIVLPICLVAVVLILAVQLYFTRKRFHLQQQLASKERQSLYADFLMTSEPFAKEIRLWNMGQYLQDMYMRLRQSIRAEHITIDWRKAMSESLVSLTGTLLLVVTLGVLLHRLTTGATSLSDIIVVVLLLLRAEIAGRSFVKAVSLLYDDKLFLTQIFSFLDLAPKIEAQAETAPLPAVSQQGVSMKKVSFSYPGATGPALEDISLDLPPGRFTALVGGNGSGKTTLIKLLCRLYDPDSGQVSYEGTDVRQLNPQDYRKEFSVIFQDFVQFAFSGAQNIHVSDLGQPVAGEQMQEAARLTGAHEVLEALPVGYDTILSRMFEGGVELSGGQWQKIALARAMYPPSKFIILDEPTSAIDPNAEAALFEGFREKLSGRAALVISHRLSTLRMADYTYVLDKGRIVEEGTHDALIAQNGIYAKMFERQGRGYRV
ncbi:ABC transporter ATP-binding protein [Epibacterium ulvae]|uniref:ABC transporter ATP-binding protein n=1 Tax=Epibacterium ulvae TaxID=1156985 RepID=UPI00248FDBEA|nr:ABC transporter ATP-binding protein [Epibacterium ulvae]